MCLLTETRALSAQGEKRALVGNLTMPEIGILELPAPPADASRCPRGDRVGREPEGDVASPHEGSVVLGPVPDAILCLVLRMHSRLHIEIMTRRGIDAPICQDKRLGCLRDVSAQALSHLATRADKPSMQTTRSIYRGFCFPPEVIAHAVFLYHRFPLSLRDVEDLLAQRGIAVSYETIRRWCRRFGPHYARNVRRQRPTAGDHWLLDEVFLQIQGRRQYLWRAIDQDGDILDILMQRRRKGRAATRFVRKLLKRRWQFMDKQQDRSSNMPVPLLDVTEPSVGRFQGPITLTHCEANRETRQHTCPRGVSFPKRKDRNLGRKGRARH